MGVDYTAVLAYGKEFDEAYEVVEFLTERNVLTREEIDEMEGEGDSYISEICYSHASLPNCDCLNAYSGYGYYLGFKISCRSPEEFEKSFNEAKEKWAAMFPNDPAEIIHTVRVW